MLNIALSHILHMYRVLFTVLQRDFENFWHSHTVLKEEGKGEENEIKKEFYHLLASYFMPGLTISY